ncbi:NAD(P)-dependent oxidoreductase [Candidatus Woesebacteria bacterium]|nr:NAD(P)-dependent oxidoreductase [Candidatus Woesebacteria bacterium]
MNEKYLIFGGSGLIGSRFIELVSEEKHIVPKEKELDITDTKALEDFFNKHADEFDVVINFAAYTNVDGAEKERGDETGTVWKINVIGAENIAKAAQKHGNFLINISTDFVFPGTDENPGPYKETAKLPEKMDNIGWYGWTKLVGEKRTQKIHSNSVIVRTAYPFRATPYELKPDFAKNILQLFDQGKLYPMFSDQQITPVFIDDLVIALEKIAELKKPGVYHVVTTDATSPFEFGNYLLEKARGAKGVVKEGSMKEFLKAPGRTPRPRLGGLDSKKTQEILGMKFKTWKQAVDEFVKQLKKE